MRLIITILAASMLVSCQPKNRKCHTFKVDVVSAYFDQHTNEKLGTRLIFNDGTFKDYPGTVGEVITKPGDIIELCFYE